jgi:hypothetical protein
MKPVPYPSGWRKVRDGSDCQKGDRYRHWLSGGSRNLEDWKPVKLSGNSTSVTAEFIVIRKKP